MTQSIVELLPELKKRWDEQDAKDRELIEVLRTNCLDALNDISDAIRRPRISLSYIEDALAKLVVARDCAKGLDSD